MASDSFSSVSESMDPESTVVERLESPDEFSLVRKWNVSNVPCRVELDENANDGVSSLGRDVWVVRREQRRRRVWNRSRRDLLDGSCVFRHIFRKVLLMSKARLLEKILEGWFCCSAGKYFCHEESHYRARYLSLYNIHWGSGRTDLTTAVIIDDVDPVV
jgi:hypothetical protein